MVAKIVNAGIIAGIVFIGFMMIMLGITILPNYSNNYNNATLTQSDEELEKMFVESKEYKAFAERFQDHEHEFFRDGNRAEFQAGAMNVETGNQIILDMRLYGGNGDRIDKDVRCDSFGPVENEGDARRMHSNGVMVKLFIETTECLN